jgi:LacI family transcriptional regulator
MATIHDVAEHAGVSATTVSRYLNRRIELPQPTASRIDAAIEALDYRPNLLARRLSTGRTEAISLVAPEIGNPFFAELMAAVEHEAQRQGYAVYMSSTRGDPALELAALRRLRDRHVDGMILMTNRVDDGTLAAMIAESGPVVLLDEDVPGAPAPRIFVENEHGTYLATRHLVAAGHRAIAFAGGGEGLLSTRQRRLGFERAMAEAGVPVRPEHLIFGAYSRSFGRLTARQLLQLDEPPTAIVAGSDHIAIGALQELNDRALSVPEDISLVGFDDVPIAELVDPPLTTIRQPIAELGRQGLQTLMALIAGHETSPLTRLPVELVVRRSVAPPRIHPMPHR